MKTIKIPSLKDIGIDLRQLQSKIESQWNVETDSKEEKKPEISLIFLDIDGVLNTTNSEHGGLSMFQVEIKDGMMDAKHAIDDKLLENLKFIKDRTSDCKIVVSSSWRGGLLYPSFLKKLNESGFDTEKDIIGCTPRLTIDGFEPRCIPRYLEIAAYLDKISNEYCIKNWVAIDDRPLYAECESEEANDFLWYHFVQTDPRFGLNDKVTNDVYYLMFLNAYDKNRKEHEKLLQSEQNLRGSK